MDGRVDPPSIPTGIARAGGRPYSARPLDIGQWANQAGVSHSRASSRRLTGLLPREIRRHRHASLCVRIGEGLSCRLFDWAGICPRGLPTTLRFVSVVVIERYAYLVPFVESENEIFLKTIIPSRKASKQYVGESDEQT
jgi:hypothetical protein